MKPDNILLDGTGHVKLADFGLSIVDVFGSKKVCGYAGTEDYMAPEVSIYHPSFALLTLQSLYYYPISPKIRPSIIFGDGCNMSPTPKKNPS